MKMMISHWQCILCLTDDNALNFPFGYFSSMKLNDFIGVDLPSQLKILIIISC